MYIADLDKQLKEANLLLEFNEIKKILILLALYFNSCFDALVFASV